jgi:hypothetical protein
MNCHRVFLFCHSVASKTTNKCLKLNIDGKVCGKPDGTCIHNWKPTKFGARPQ